MNYRQVHLDFHTSEAIEGIGKEFSKKQFQEMLQTGHVDSITVFSKCHHGWAYHPSVANEMHPNLQFDLLKAQIEAAHEIGVKTPVYISAGYDERIAVKHPEWLAVGKENGAIIAPDFTFPHYHFLCMNSPYLDYLLAQIEEVVKNYDADGIFLDIVNVRPCYCHNCVKTLLDAGKDPMDEEASRELAEKVYANYTDKVRETIDRVKPGLPVFHNGGHITRGRRDLAHKNTHLEIESLPTGGWGYDHFPLSASYVQTLGMDYLGMTGKFHGAWGEFGGYKHENALRYEVALSAAFGAKCSVGDQLHPNGKMDYATYHLIGAAYSELEEKEPWLEKAKPIADIGVLSMEAVASAKGIQDLSSYTQYDTGVVRILLEGKYLFQLLDMEADFSKYKILILPDDVQISGVLEEKIKAFLQNGGKLLATGASGLDKENKDFVFDFGAVHLGENPFYPDYMVPDFDIKDMNKADYVLYGQGQKIALNGGKILAYRRNPYFNRSPFQFCSHRHTPYDPASQEPGIVEGRDGIYISWKVFEDYATNGSLIVKRTVCYALDRLLGKEKTLDTNLPAQGVATLTYQEAEKRYVLHLLYANTVKRGINVEVIEDLLPVYNITVTLQVDNPVKDVYLAPQGKPLEYQRVEGGIQFVVECLQCHQMVVINEE